MAQVFVLPKPKKTESAIDYSLRKELAVMNFIIRKLLSLPVEARHRIMNYLCDRYGVKRAQMP